MKKLDMHSPDVTQTNIERIREFFPGCVTEAKADDGIVKLAVDFDQLRQELSESIVEGPQERYRLDWPGKRNALLLANASISKTLRPAESESISFKETKNIFVEGDNLDALKLLQETYLKKIKLIYIDPPYNTGRNLIYKNNFHVDQAEYLEKTEEADALGNRLVANTLTNGRFHSDWLSMIYARLKLAKNLLAADGVLVCTIDENEQETLGMVLKEVFGESGYEHVCVTIVHNPRGIQGTNFSYTHEYAFLVFPSGIKAIGERKIEDVDVKWSQFRNWGGESERKDAKNCFYPVIVEDGQVVGFGDVSDNSDHPGQTVWQGKRAFVYPIDREGVERKWRYARQSVDEVAKLLRARKTEEGYEIEIGKNFGQFRTVWLDKRFDANEYGTKVVDDLVKGAGFTFPKSLWAVYDTIKAVCENDPNAIIMDFFAGSATTAHAVMQLNADDGGNRRFVLVQIPEPCDSTTETFKLGFKTIADISKERIRQAGKKILQGNCHHGWSKDIGFRVLKLDSSNLKGVEFAPDQLGQADLLANVDSVKEGRTSEDLLFQVLVDWGIDLGMSIEKKRVGDKSVFYVGKSDSAACFDSRIDEAVVREMAANKPLRVVFRDTAFASDADKINAEQLFKQLSPDTEVRAL